MSDDANRSQIQTAVPGRLSRRSLMAGTLGLSAGAVALGGLPRTTALARQNQGLKGKIRMQAHDYTPSESMNKSPNNPVPHRALQDVIDSYTQLHPEVEVEIVRVPEGTESRVWTVTQMTGGTVPEIAWTQAWEASLDIGKGWWVELDPYLQAPNPYVEAGQPGSAKWIDQFFEGPTAAKVASDGHIYVVPYDLVTSYFFYNKQLFEQAGAQVPQTYADLITVTSQLQAAGAVPYNGLLWARSQLREMLLRVLKAEVPATGAGGAYTIKDVTLAILAGVFSYDSPRYKDYLRLMKDFVPYWSPEWTLASTDPDAVSFDLQFTQGRLAILEDGSWRFGLLNANEELDFEWGTFFMPTLTQGTGPGLSEFADGQPAPAIGGATANQYGVTKSAVENGTVDLAVDFLRYICAPAQASAIIGELGQFLPNIKGVEVNQDLAPALAAVSSTVGEAGMISYDDKITEEAYYSIAALEDAFLLGKADVDKTAADIQAVLVKQAQETAATNGWT